jgi:hypothetical protein
MPTPPGTRNPPRQQCADAVLMVRPKCFGFNPETAATNTFQQREAPGDSHAAVRAAGEFEALRQGLISEGVTVVTVEDTQRPVKPDAVFPNNWVSFHADGTLVLYPMQCPSRRCERRGDVIDQVASELPFRVSHLLDLTYFEAQGKYLEGTGSLVLDHPARIAYACVSGRTHPEVVGEWARELGYEAVTFEAVGRAGAPLYHTNVLMWIGARVALIGSEAIVPSDRARVLSHLKASGRLVIEVGHDEIESFAGNMLELGTWDEALGDARVLVMSGTARQGLSGATFAQLSGCTDTVLTVPIPTIEKLGGGSVRCMLAEVFRTA